jgi:hypothetical protein
MLYPIELRALELQSLPCAAPQFGVVTEAS